MRIGDYEIKAPLMLGEHAASMYWPSSMSGRFFS